MRKGLQYPAGIMLAAGMCALGITQPALAAAGEAAAAAQGALQPWPITLTIRTVPALAGIRFTFDGTHLVTRRGGTVSITERHNFSRHTLQIVDTRISRRDRRYTFARWAGQRDPNQAFLPMVHGLPMRASYTVTAAFGALCPVTPDFADQNGRQLDRRRITLVSLRSNTGRPARMAPMGTSWLRCERAVYQGSRLRSRNVQYSVQSVMFEGANVVHIGVERFSPRRNPRPTITGYFHDLTIAAHDALFGNGTGTVAVVTLPDRSQRRIRLGPGHAVTLSNLPQGVYRVDVKAGHGIVSAQNLRLSRDQAVSLADISVADLAALGGSLFVLVAGLPLMSATRRKQLLTVLRRHRREPASA